MVSYGLNKLIIEATSQVLLIIYLNTFDGFFFRKTVVTMFINSVTVCINEK